MPKAITRAPDKYSYGAVSERIGVNSGIADGHIIDDSSPDEIKRTVIDAFLNDAVSEGDEHG